MGTSNLSGKDWWRANQARYPNSQRSTTSIRVPLEGRRFIGSLRDAGLVIVVAPGGILFALTSCTTAGK